MLLRKAGSTVHVQNPACLVYGSAALVASLREQQSHFATLPTSGPVATTLISPRRGTAPQKDMQMKASSLLVKV